MNVLQPDILGALCIYAEAREEPFEGQVAVGLVIRNRMALHYSSDGTVAGTIFQPYQFSWTSTYDPQRIHVFKVQEEDPAWLEAQRAWFQSAIKGGDLPPRTVLYHADYVHPHWADRARFVRQIGRHRFYED